MIRWVDASWRAEAWIERGAWSDAAVALEPFPEALTGDDRDACRARWALGRARYKSGDYGDALEAMGDVASDCAAHLPYGADAAYLAGRAAWQKGWFKTAAARYEAMARAIPDHRYADDGWVLAGRAWDKAGEPEKAEASWLQALERTPEGDLLPQAIFGLAWSKYDAGDGAAAAELARSLAAMPVTQDPLHVSAGRYWAGRWAMYPDVDTPTDADDDGRSAAVAAWAALVAEQPWSFYAVLAWSRLQEVAPEVAATLEPPAADPGPSTWSLDPAWRATAEVDATARFLSLGLVAEARRSWGAVESPTADQMAWYTASRYAAGDSIRAHANLRHWLRSNPVAQPDADAWSVLRVAYPDLWWEDVRERAADSRFPARYFHAESNFDPSAISWAGARGLCQVMPSTGEYVGKWMDLDVGADDLLDPDLNLRLGVRYMDFLHERFGDSPFLAAAGYNAGQGRVGQWLSAWGNLPTDEFVERIPYDETRGYVKRVVGTWQAYRLVADGEPLLDLSRYNHQAVPHDG